MKNSKNIFPKCLQSSLWSQKCFQKFPAFIGGKLFFVTTLKFVCCVVLCSKFVVIFYHVQSYKHSSRDPGLLYRVDNMPGLGWMLTKSLYKGELESKWPMRPQKDSWDGWLRAPAQRKDR